MPNTEQIKNLVRWVLAWISGVFTGWLGARNILTAEQLAQVSQFFTSETVVALITGLGGMTWGLIRHMQSNEVKAVASMPEVKAVQVEPTPAGINLKNAVGSSPGAVVTVGSGAPTSKEK